MSDSGARQALYRLRAGRSDRLRDDHPGYHRCGKRDKDGNITEAWGVDLSPLATRHQEFIDKIKQYEFEQLEKKRLLRKRRMLFIELTADLQTAIRDKLPGTMATIFCPS